VTQFKEDPKARETLLRARAEIEEVLTRHDIAGMCILHCAPTSAEVISHLSPSYSIIKIVDDMAHLESKLEKYNGDEAAQRRDLEATANMASTMMELAIMLVKNVAPLAPVLDEETGATHTAMKQVKPH
jgi:hypothetical protein